MNTILVGGRLGYCCSRDVEVPADRERLVGRTGLVEPVGRLASQAGFA